jgi:hypothetical protein
MSLREHFLEVLENSKGCTKDFLWQYCQEKFWFPNCQTDFMLNEVWAIFEKTYREINED